MARASESVQPILDIGGVARLAHLAVVDDGHACRDLLSHGQGDGGEDLLTERRGIDGRAISSPSG
jgi:hypothetical protein